MTKLRPRICIVGQLVGRNKGFITTQGQVLAESLAKEGFEITSVSSKLNRLVRMVDVVRTIVRTRASIDLLIVEVYSGLSFVLADIASSLGRICGIPVVFVLHGGNLPEFGEKHPRWTRRVLRRARHLVAPSAFLATKMARFGGEMTVIPNIVNLKNYNYRVRRMIRPRILWMRSFHDIYDPELALRAFARIRNRFADASLVMAGPDKGMQQEIVDLAQDLGLADRCRFPGFLDDDQKREEFDKAGIFLNTTRIDNMPVGVVEACAAGLPVVAANVGGISTLLTDRSSGMLVESRDPDALAEAIENLIEDPDLAETLSRNGRAVADNSAWPNVMAKWCELFERILGLQPHAPASGAQENLRQSEA